MHRSHYTTDLSKQMAKRLRIYSRSNFDARFFYNAIHMVYPDIMCGEYARVLFVGLSEETLLSFPCTITCQQWPIMIWKKYSSQYTTNLSKKLAENLRTYSWNIFDTRFFDAIILVCRIIVWGLRLNFCLCDYQTVLSFYHIVQLPSRNNLQWCRQRIAPIAQRA